jgi:transcription elongation factor GreA
MSNDLLFTAEGLEKIRKELEQLKGPERARIADNIREAKSHGDLRENAMYHEAKLNQRRLESRIAELERVVQYARIIETSGEEGKATLNCRVTLEDLEFGDTLTIELVGAFEADPINDKISIASPLGAAVLDRAVGDEIVVDAPAGEQRYKILNIE